MDRVAGADCPIMVVGGHIVRRLPEAVITVAIYFATRPFTALAKAL